MANSNLPYSLFATPYSPTSHRPVGPHVGRHGDAELDLADRLDDVVAEQLREAGITPVVHVQAVGDDETVDRDILLLVPVAHPLEARKHADVAQFGDPAEQPHHLAGAFSLGIDRGGVLRIDQHQIGAGFLNPPDALLDHGGGLARIEVAQYRVGAD